MTEPTDKQLLNKALANEQQLDEYLKGDSSVSRQYRQLHSAEVPAELDHLVLRQAEDAVKSRSSQRPAWVRWTPPLAVAASAVLALAIVIETGVRDETMVTHAPQPTMQAKQRLENKAEESFVAEPGAAVAPSPAEATADTEGEVAADKRGMSPQPESVTRAAPPPPPRMDTSSPQAIRAEEPVAQTEAPKAVAQTRPIPAPFAPPPAQMAESAQSLARSADIAERELHAAAIEEAAQKQSAGVADERARAPAAVSYSRRISAEMPPMPRLYTDPEAWLKDIRQLRKDNKQEEADREWRRFLGAFPNYEVAENDMAREAKK